MTQRWDVEVVGLGHAQRTLGVVSNQQLVNELAGHRETLARWAKEHPGFRTGDWLNLPTLADVRANCARRKHPSEDRMLDITSEADWPYVLEAALDYLTVSSDEWLQEAPRIKERRRAKPGMATSDLAVEAADEALKVAERQCGVDRREVDGIVVATVSPDRNRTTPTSVYLPRPLGIPIETSDGRPRRLVFHDLTEACSSFMVAFGDAVDLLLSGSCKLVIVVGADTMSTTYNPAAKVFSCVLGDGAGAMVLRRVERAEGEDRNFDPSWFFSYLNSEGADVIVNWAGGSRMPLTPEMAANPWDRRDLMWMDGPTVRKWVVRALIGRKFDRSSLITAALEGIGFPMTGPEDLARALNFFARLYMSQANGSMCADVLAYLRGHGYSGDCYSNGERWANATSASLPVQFSESWREGRLLPGDWVNSFAFGAGWTFALMRWRNTLKPPG